MRLRIWYEESGKDGWFGDCILYQQDVLRSVTDYAGLGGGEIGSEPVKLHANGIFKNFGVFHNHYTMLRIIRDHYAYVFFFLTIEESAGISSQYNNLQIPFRRKDSLISIVHNKPLVFHRCGASQSLW